MDQKRDDDTAPTRVLPARVRVTTDISRLPTLPMPVVTPTPTPPHTPSIYARILGLFVTNPSSGQSLAYVDGLRALAALSVVIFHVWSEAPKATFLLPIPLTRASLDFAPIVKHGGIGVYLFFILSGFLLARPWIAAHADGKPSPNLRHYFTLRLTRIMPAYYTALAIVLIFFTPSLVPAIQVYSPVGAFTVAAHLLFVQFLFPVSSTSFYIALPLWSLSIEMLFYCLLPLVVRAFYGRRWLLALPAGALVSFAYLFAVPLVLPVLVPRIVQIAATLGAPWYTAEDAIFYIANQLPAHAFAFALGMTLANLTIRLRRGQPGRALAVLTHPTTGAGLVIAGAALILVTIYQISYGQPLIRMAGIVPDVNPSIGWRAENLIAQYFEWIISTGCGLILLGVICGGRTIRAILGFTPLRIIGIVSYSIYLLHLPLLHNVIRLYPAILHQTPNTRFGEYLTTLLVQLVPLALVLYLVVERPAMRWARERTRRAPSSH